jgi:hypothetical protein
MLILIDSYGYTEFVDPAKYIPASVKITKLPPGIESPHKAVTNVRSLSGNHLLQN